MTDAQASGGRDVVTQLQDELVKLGFLMTNACERTQQQHAPQVAPNPPPGVNPHEFIMNWARKRQEEKPFATRGFNEEEQSADLAGNESNMKARGETMLEVVAGIEKLLEQADEFDKSEEEQLAELESLEKENEEAGKELEAAVAKGKTFLDRVAGLQRQVAAGALGF